jgi:hypothetical protein
MPHYFFDLTDNKTVHDFKGKQLANIQLARQHVIGIARELIKDEIDAFERTHFSLVGHCEGWKIPEVVFRSHHGRHATTRRLRSTEHSGYSRTWPLSSGAKLGVGA